MYIDNVIFQSPLNWNPSYVLDNTHQTYNGFGLLFELKDWEPF